MKKLMFLFLIFSGSLSAQIIIRPEAFGAKCNGIADDIIPLEQCVEFCRKQPLPCQIVISGICRTTRSWFVPNKPYNDTSLFKQNLSNTNINKIDNFQEFMNGKWCQSISIKFEPNAGIYADFDSGVVVYYFMPQTISTKNSVNQANGNLENVSIYGKGSFVNGKFDASKSSFNNKLIGLLTIFTGNLQFKKALFHGLNLGWLQNNNYFMDAAGARFSFCNLGVFSVQSPNASNRQFNTSFCKKGIELRSDLCKYENYYANFCNTGLHVTGSGNKFELCYLENPLTSDVQLIIGDDSTDSIVGRNLVEGNIFESLVIVSSKNSSPSLGVWWKKSSRTMTINSGSLQSQYFKYNPETRVEFKNVKGMLPATIKQ